MADLLTFDSKVTIDGANPIQGSVSISMDEGNTTIAYYEGGEIAGYKIGSKQSVTMQWQTFSGSPSAPASKSVTASCGSSSLTVTGIYSAITSWHSDWGFVVQHKVTGTVGSGT